MAEGGTERSGGPGAPGDGPGEGALPHALTFFLSAAQRRALLRALGIETD